MSTSVNNPVPYSRFRIRRFTPPTLAISHYLGRYPSGFDPHNSSFSAKTLTHPSEFGISSLLTTYSAVRLMFVYSPSSLPIHHQSSALAFHHHLSHLCRTSISLRLVTLPSYNGTFEGRPYRRRLCASSSMDVTRPLEWTNGMEKYRQRNVNATTLRSTPSQVQQRIGLFVHHLDRTKERMFCSRYLGAGHLAIVDKYYNLSYQKTIITIIFLTRSAAWSSLSVHQVITPSIFPFYNNLAVSRGMRSLSPEVYLNLMENLRG